MILKKQAPTGYAVGPAEQDHIPFLPSIERAAARMFPTGRVPEEQLDDAVPDAVLAEAAREGRLWTAFADGGDEPVGFALLGIIEGLAVLAEVDILPDHGRRGIGRELIAHVAEEAEQRGFDWLYLTTFADIPWNASYYERLGFAPLAEGEVPTAVYDLLADEQERGFDGRVAMRLKIGNRHNHQIAGIE